MGIILKRGASALLLACGWLVAGMRAALDVIGWSTAPDDVAVTMSRIDQAFLWLLSIPWWIPWGFALISTMWMIWVSWPRPQQAAAPPPVPPQKTPPDDEALDQIADLEARNKDLQEQIEGLSKQDPPPRMNAFAYLRRPDKNILIIEWNAPVRDQNAAVALDYRPRGEKPKRIVLSSQVSLTERQTVKTVICQPNSRGSWAWNVEGGDGIVIHEGIVMCRLAIIGSDDKEYYWRFCIADRTFQQTPHVIGENVFEDNFER